MNSTGALAIGAPAPVWAMPAALQQLADFGDTELVDELLSIFQSDTASRLESLRLSLEAGDRAGIRTEGHTIKGSALQVGANRVAEVCRQMEQGAHTLELAELKQLFSLSLASFHEVCDFFAARAAGLGT